MDRTQKVIERVNKYLSLTRYRYSAEEKLSRLQILNDYYSAIPARASEEIFTSDIQMAEKLSEKLLLPLKVRGVFLTEGRPAMKFYKSVELLKASMNPINSSFPIMLDHRDNEASAVVGMVDKIEYDSTLRGIRWWGHINDETFARNVADKAIKEVSVTVFSTSIEDEKLGVCGVDLTFKELSLVMKGAEPRNFIEVDA